MIPRPISLPIPEDGISGVPTPALLSDSPSEAPKRNKKPSRWDPVVLKINEAKSVPRPNLRDVPSRLFTRPKVGSTTTTTASLKDHHGRDGGSRPPSAAIPRPQRGKGRTGRGGAATAIPTPHQPPPGSGKSRAAKLGARRENGEVVGGKGGPPVESQSNLSFDALAVVVQFLDLKLQVEVEASNRLQSRLAQCKKSEALANEEVRRLEEELSREREFQAGEVSRLQSLISSLNSQLEDVKSFGTVGEFVVPKGGSLEKECASLLVVLQLRNDEVRELRRQVLEEKARADEAAEEADASRTLRAKVEDLEAQLGKSRGDKRRLTQRLADLEVVSASLGSENWRLSQVTEELSWRLGQTPAPNKEDEKL